MPEGSQALISRWPEYLKRPGKRWAWLRVGRLLGEYRMPQDSAAGRRRLEQALEERRGAEDGEACKPIRRGWLFGADPLKRKLLAQVRAKAGPFHYGEELRESAEAKPERMVQDVLAERGWREETLRVRRKGDAEEVPMAQRLCAQTTVTLA